jgi:hypothetical protein
MLHTSFLYFNPRPFAILKEDYAARIESGSVPVQYYYHAAYVRETNNEASELLATLNDWFDSNSACVAVYYWLRRELDGTRQQFFDILVDIMRTYDEANLFNFNVSTNWRVTVGQAVPNLLEARKAHSSCWRKWLMVRMWNQNHPHNQPHRPVKTVVHEIPRASKPRRKEKSSSRRSGPDRQITTRSRHRWQTICVMPINGLHLS